VPIASTALAQIQAGKVRPLAVTSQARMPALPDVPTLREHFRSDDMVLDSWGGFWAPAGTPAAVVDTLFKAFARTHADAGVRAAHEAAGSLVAPSASPEEFSQFVRAETVKLERLVKSLDLTVN